MINPMLEARGLEKRYKNRQVVRGVDLSVHAGEVVGLLGPNGAGKTTTFYMMVGMAVPTAGGVFLDGESISALPMHLRARRGIAYLPQESSVFRKLTVAENLLAVLETLDLSRTARTARMEALLSEFHLSPFRHRRADTLSGGERRRLEIARSLVLSPRFLLLDEPFAGVDPILVAQIQEIIRRLKRQGIGVLITDHHVEATLAITDRAYILSDGAVLVSGTPAEIVCHPQARAIYLGGKISHESPAEVTLSGTA